MSGIAALLPEAPRRRQYVRGSVAERFEAYHIPEPNSGCWLWFGSCDRKGYGQLRINNYTLRLASHIALELAGVSVPKGMYACHHCDNPGCVNPAHLFIGSAKENQADSIRKGRKSLPPKANPGQGTKEFCLRLHPLSGDNLGFWNGARYCRECRKIWKRNQRLRRKAAVC